MRFPLARSVVWVIRMNVLQSLTSNNMFWCVKDEKKKRTFVLLEDLNEPCTFFYFFMGSSLPGRCLFPTPCSCYYHYPRFGDVPIVINLFPWFSTYQFIPLCVYFFSSFDISSGSWSIIRLKKLSRDPFWKKTSYENIWFFFFFLLLFSFVNRI